jgi:hypothetical protein
MFRCQAVRVAMPRVLMASYSSNTTNSTMAAAANAFAAATANSSRPSSSATFAETLHAMQRAILSPSHGALQTAAPAVVKQYWSNLSGAVNVSTLGELAMRNCQTTLCTCCTALWRPVVSTL